MPDVTVCVYLFLIFSIAGWLLEVAYRSVSARRLVNPGFLRGPYLPLYGLCAVLLTLFSAVTRHQYLIVISPLFTLFPRMSHIPETGIITILEFVSNGLLYAMITTGAELVAGLFFGNVLKRPLWNYQGRSALFNCVCLQFSCYWVALAFAFEYGMLPWTLATVQRIDPHVLELAARGLGALMILDFGIQASISLRGLRRGITACKPADRNEFNAIVAPLLEIPEVKQLAEYKHHLNRSRLDHSLEVAWYGYVLCKRGNCDGRAAARAGLLHDLFHYDWLTQGPRLHGFRHPAIALTNASAITSLSRVEQDIIKKHMWPLTLIPPRYPESWAVCLADTYCSVKDYLLPTILGLRASFSSWLERS